MAHASLPVLIAGAGPVGCIAAFALGRQGIPVTVLEAGAAPAIDLRASTFHPPTLDMLDDLGLLDDLLPQGLRAPVFQHRDRVTGAVFSFDLGLLAGDTRHPYRLQCEQFKLTKAIVERLRTMPNVALRFSRRVVHVRQDGASVAVAAEAPAAIEHHQGRYLLAADGANSIVRKWLGIEFEGFTYPEKFYCITTPFPFERHFENLAAVNYIADPSEWHVLLRVPELWRVLVPVPETMDDATILGDAFTERTLQGIVRADRRYETVHRTIYRVHQRVAKAYRRGNVFLMGDSAHINNPLGGMGMNGGIHDAANLCEKLALVLRGAEGDAILDRYERQRRTVVIDHVQAQTARNKAELEARGDERRRQREAEMRRLTEQPALLRAFLLRTSMIQSLRDAAAIQ